MFVVYPYESTLNAHFCQAKGNIPSLAHHSCSIYKSELYVFGGLQPSRGPGGKACSNALYIFNPEHELWYQPIVEGDRPLPRFGLVCNFISCFIPFLTFGHKSMVCMHNCVFHASQYLLIFITGTPAPYCLTN